MDLHIARQPVFDERKNVIGYELLHRETDVNNEYTTEDGGYASSRVITGAFLSMGLESLTGNKLAFINFTSGLLKRGIASLFPKEKLVVEILEDVAPTQEIIHACEELKSNGYSLALDDYVLDPIYEPIAALADIIKVDFRQTSEADQRRALMMYRNRPVQFLAEKVETEEEFLRAADMGYALFQGYFFSRPIILSACTLPVNKLGYIRLMQAVNSPSPDFRHIVSAIESDVTLSLETIKLSNSAFYGRRQKISSIRQAVVALGLDGIRKWIYLAALRRLGMGKPDVLISTSIIRSKFMELLADLMNLRPRGPEFSMVGLFSLLDALTGCPFDSLLASLNLTEEIKEILMASSGSSQMGRAYETMLAYERGEWVNTSACVDKLNLSLDSVAGAYIQSLQWYNDFMSLSEA